MVRVCAPGGRIVVIDMYASDDPAKAAEWNRAEKLRDPSHVRCLTLPELKGLFGTAGLSDPRASFYELRDEIRNLLARSFPNPGDDAKIIEMFAASAEDDRLGIPVRREGDRIDTPIRSPFWLPTGCQSSSCERPHHYPQFALPRRHGAGTPA